MIILRTFCPFDIDKLADGFDSWVNFFPCGNAELSPPPADRMGVDILLYFSAAWDLWPKAKESADTIVRNFNGGVYPWSRCFGNMYVDSALLPPEQDAYEPPKQQINRLWVNGPNRQFEKGLRACQFPVTEAHGWQLAYLMEPDSVPLRPFWLDRLLKEIEERRSFAVLGSKYRGDKWYDFIHTLEVPLLNHINGNGGEKEINLAFFSLFLLSFYFYFLLSFARASRSDEPTYAHSSLLRLRVAQSVNQPSV